MASDIYETVRQYDSCARNRITEKKHTNVMKLIPASCFFWPMDSVSMDILGPLPERKMETASCWSSQIGSKR
jgi:hypothetical protein